MICHGMNSCSDCEDRMTRNDILICISSVHVDNNLPTLTKKKKFDSIAVSKCLIDKK